MKISKRPTDNLRLSYDSVRGTADLIDAGRIDGADEAVRQAVAALHRSLSGELSKREHVPMGRDLTPHMPPAAQHVATTAALLRGTRLRRINQRDRQHAADLLDRAWEGLRARKTTREN